MIVGASRFLGVAVGEASLTFAEVSGKDGLAVRRVAQFKFADGVCLEKPDAAGSSLASFLREHRFGATRCVVGVPAKWLMAVECDVPPAHRDQLHALLRLNAERMGNGEMVFDYTAAETGMPGRVLMVGMQRQQLSRVESMLEAAGLSVAAVTPTSLAVAWWLTESQTQRPLIVATRAGVEMVWQSDGSTRLLRHIGALGTNGHGPTLAPLVSPLRRAVSLSPAGAAGAGLTLWDGAGLDSAAAQSLSADLGLDVRAASAGMRIDALRAAALPDSDQGALAQFLPAVALAAAAARKAGLTPDFKHSRLAPPRMRRIGPHTILGIVAGIVVCALLTWLYVEVRLRAGELSRLAQATAAREKEVAAAQQLVDRATYASGFFTARPASLECLRELTLCFRDDESIWTTALTLRDRGRGQLSGRATDQRLVLNLQDRIKKNPRFKDVKVMDIREAGTRGGECTFSLSFVFGG